MTFRASNGLPMAVLMLALGAGCSAPPSDTPPEAPPSARELRRIELEKRRDQVEADRTSIGPFRLVSSRYRHEVQKNGWQRPMLDLVLENGTKLRVARFTVLLTLSSPDRQEPWLRQEFLVNLNRPLDPGARHQTTLTPSADSPWGMLQAPTDATMRVEVMTVRTPDGKTFLGPGAFTPQDAAELVSLARIR